MYINRKYSILNQFFLNFNLECKKTTKFVDFFAIVY